MKAKSVAIILAVVTVVGIGVGYTATNASQSFKAFIASHTPK